MKWKSICNRSNSHLPLDCSYKHKGNEAIFSSYLHLSEYLSSAVSWWRKIFPRLPFQQNTCMMKQHKMANVIQKLKKTDIFYNGEGLRVYCYHFYYPACHFLVLRVAIIPQILVLLHFCQCMLSFCHFTWYSSAFLSISSSCFNYV